MKLRWKPSGSFIKSKDVPDPEANSKRKRSVKAVARVVALVELVTLSSVDVALVRLRWKSLPRHHSMPDTMCR